MMLYIHLPFCKRKCKYCAFCSGTFSQETQSQYIDRVISLIKHYTCNKHVETIYIGGGTPSALALPLWERLLSSISGVVDVSALQEFTVECNPESTEEKLLAMLKAGGVNRLSFGIQSLCDSELLTIGRLHSAQTARHALRLASQMGFKNISADLIYGLPGQTVESFVYSLKSLLCENINHLSCYNLQIEENTPLFEERNDFSLPDEDAQLEMYEQLCTLTKQAGFVHYEISNFCKDDCEAVHNSGYWSGKDYIGIGAAAHSKIGNKRYSFTSDVLAFIEKSNCLFDEQIDLTHQDIRQENIMLGLRTYRGVPLSILDNEKVERFVQLKLGRVENGYFILNDKGFMVSNSIITELI